MSKLDDINLIKRLDKSDMHHLITHLPEQIYKAYFDFSICNLMFDIAGQSASYSKPTEMVLCGMGGSAIAGDITKAIFDDKIPITVVKNYTLPTVLEGCSPLYIIISYSGDTEETICCFKQAIKNTQNVIVITSGGIIKEMAKGKCSIVELPKDLPARVAIGYLFFSILKVLEMYRIADNYSARIKHLVGNLMQKAGSLCVKMETEMNLAKSSALSIYPKIPLIYCSNPSLFPVAYRWKCQINENAKMPAFYNSIPELCHNEIESWTTKTYQDMFVPIFLRSFNDKKEHFEKGKVFKTMLESNKIDYLEFLGDSIILPNSSDNLIDPIDYKIFDIFTLIYLGDVISFYLAILNNVDPSEIKNIEYIKKQLNKENKDYV